MIRNIHLPATLLVQMFDNRNQDQKKLLAQNRSPTASLSLSFFSLIETLLHGCLPVLLNIFSNEHIHINMMLIALLSEFIGSLQFISQLLCYFRHFLASSSKWFQNTELLFLDFDCSNFCFFQVGQRTAAILKYLFPVPKPDTKRIITFSNQSDYISFRLVCCVICLISDLAMELVLLCSDLNDQQHVVSLGVARLTRSNLFLNLDKKDANLLNFCLLLFSGIYMLSLIEFLIVQTPCL